MVSLILMLVWLALSAAVALAVAIISDRMLGTFTVQPRPEAVRAAQPIRRRALRPRHPYQVRRPG